jgi:glyoxylase-like metal-dependent hydrolase (beta-lactamase superfamily II)
VQFAQRVINAFPQLELRLPDYTFNDFVEIKGTKRTVEFLTFGGGHTDSDALLYLPAERVLLAGDLLVVDNHPALFKGHPRKWLEILAHIKALDPLYLMPGHGELASISDISQIERYITDTFQMAEQNWRQGGNPESASTLQPPAFTNGWANSDIFGTNMKFLHELVQQEI